MAVYFNTKKSLASVWGPQSKIGQEASRLKRIIRVVDIVHIVALLAIYATAIALAATKGLSKENFVYIAIGEGAFTLLYLCARVKVYRFNYTELTQEEVVALRDQEGNVKDLSRATQDKQEFIRRRIAEGRSTFANNDAKSTLNTLGKCLSEYSQVGKEVKSCHRKSGLVNLIGLGLLVALNVTCTVLALKVNYAAAFRLWAIGPLKGGMCIAMISMGFIRELDRSIEASKVLEFLNAEESALPKLDGERPSPADGGT